MLECMIPSPEKSNIECSSAERWDFKVAVAGQEKSGDVWPIGVSWRTGTRKPTLFARDKRNAPEIDSDDDKQQACTPSFPQFLHNTMASRIAISSLRASGAVLNCFKLYIFVY